MLCLFSEGRLKYFDFIGVVIQLWRMVPFWHNLLDVPQYNILYWNWKLLQTWHAHTEKKIILEQQDGPIFEKS